MRLLLRVDNWCPVGNAHHPFPPFLCFKEHKHYRNFVLFTCKTLKSFDMSPVTQSERDMNAIWALTFRKKLFPDQDD